jgi:hypothetical protein
MAIPDEAVSLSAERNSESGPFTLRLASGEHVGARSVVIRHRRQISPSHFAGPGLASSPLWQRRAVWQRWLWPSWPQQKSRNDAVTAFAKRMIDDHAKSNALICQ